VTAKITGYAVYQGLATSLDTLCGQAYGAGRKYLVGLHLQRMVCFLILVTIPIGCIWLNGARILKIIVPDDNNEIVGLAGLYLKIALWGAPGYAIFESGKRFVQSQGLFNASLYVLLIAAPFNLFLNWLLVWVSTSLSVPHESLHLTHSST
jgi:MATE family multidrug resistance protein